jgi:hypothetical protein
MYTQGSCESVIAASMERHLLSSEAILISLRYGNQAEVAEGLKKAFKEIPGLKREDVFIVRFASHRSVSRLLTCFFLV